VQGRKEDEILWFMALERSEVVGRDDLVDVEVKVRIFLLLLSILSFTFLVGSVFCSRSRWFSSYCCWQLPFPSYYCRVSSGQSEEFHGL
jgi:hypothetical protein